ncbi:MAG: phytoene/squalene synthase family protein [Mariniphaga sp.]
MLLKEIDKPSAVNNRHPVDFLNLYDTTAIKISKVVTQSYSTSFSLATSLLKKQHRDAIYAIYGFVRLADEIVDSFHEYPKEHLLNKIEADLKESLEQGICINPVLHSFQMAVKKYNIPFSYIRAFLDSMKADLLVKSYSTKQLAGEYIYGSAEVVGLMCLRVFTDGNASHFDALKEPAKKLGSAFQKVNFLRDLKNDTGNLDRVYFPELTRDKFTELTKKKIVTEIESEFDEALKGIQKLPDDAKVAVLTAYYYYRILLLKIKNTPAENILESRIRISNLRKFYLLIKAKFVCQFNLI